MFFTLFMLVEFCVTYKTCFCSNNKNIRIVNESIVSLKLKNNFVV